MNFLLGLKIPSLMFHNVVGLRVLLLKSLIYISSVDNLKLDACSKV